MFNRVVGGRLQRDQTAALDRRARTQSISEAEVPGLQLAALASVWADAVRDVPYYRGLAESGRAPSAITGWQDVGRIPVLTRRILQEQPAAFQRLSHAPEGYTNTAGSTGTPIEIGMDQSERDLLRVVKLAEWQEFGYQEGSRLFLIWGHAHLLGAGWRGQINQLRRRVADGLLGYRRVDAYRLSPSRSAEIAEELIRFCPLGLIGYSAALDLFGRHTVAFRDRFRALRMGFVLATTEAPPRDDTVALLEDLFGCPVVQEYGGGDFGQVAFKRGDAPFEVYSDLNYCECDREDPDQPDASSLLVSTLYPRYTPLIRYRVGDGVRDPQVLPNGHVRRFTSIAGRLTDAIPILGGEAIHSLSIFHCVHQERDVYNVQMRLTDDGIDILLVTAPNTDRLWLERRIRPRLADVHPALGLARFVYVDDLETSRAGKRRWCIDLRSHPPSCVESQAS